MKDKDIALRQLDLLMWNVNHPTGLTNITSVMFFKNIVDEHKVIKALADRIGRYHKFKEKVIVKNGKPVWHIDELFDIKSHVHKVALPGKGDEKELTKMISDLISSPLDYTKPLWQVHLIEGYKEGSILLWRIHHAIGDGASLINVLLKLNDEANTTTKNKIQESTGEETSSSSINWYKKWNEAIGLTQKTFERTKSLLLDEEKRSEIIEGAKNTFEDVKSFLTSNANSNSIYKGELGVQKKVALSKTFSLNDIKLIGKCYSAKVNDVLLAALTGAIRKHMLYHHQDTNVSFNVACPVDVRSKKDKFDLSNKVGAIVINLPINETDIEARIKAITRKTKRLKKSFEPPLVHYYTQFISDFIPKQIELFSAQQLGNKLMAILSNVPGPRQSISFAGEKIDNLMFWLPHTYSMGLALSVISYNNKVTLGITVDANLIKDPSLIVQFFEEELDEMMIEINPL